MFNHAVQNIMCTKCFQPQKKGNLVYADADTVTKTTGSNEGQDVEGM